MSPALQVPALYPDSSMTNKRLSTLATPEMKSDSIEPTTSGCGSIDSIGISITSFAASTIKPYFKIF